MGERSRGRSGARHAVKVARRLVIVIPLFLATPLLRRWRWSVVWVVNAGSPSDRRAYGPFAKLTERPGWEVLPAGLFRIRGVGWGLIVGTASLNEDLRSSADRCERVLAAATRFRARRIALNGVLPACLVAHGIWPEDSRVVRGQYATVHMIRSNVVDVHERRPELAKRPVAVVGVGATGQLVANELARGGYDVVALDIRAEAATGLDPRVRFVGMDTGVLANVGVIVLLSTGGDAGAASIIRDVTPANVVISDTHPKLSRAGAEALVARGIAVYESALTRRGTRFVPKLPNWEADTIPGCVAQAIVERKLGRPVTDQDAFEILGSRLLTSRLDDPESLQRAERAAPDRELSRS